MTSHAARPIRAPLRLTLLTSALALATAAPLAMAQEKYPSRPVELVVTFGPGGGADGMGRKMSQLLEK
nr:tripartite tricarboxylate transporter substrate binding protein [Rubrivivax sp.]